jgi:DNA processing protein
MKNFSSPKYSKQQLSRLQFLLVPGVGRHTIRKLESEAKKRKVKLAEMWNNVGTYGREFGLGQVQIESAVQFKKNFNLENYLENLSAQRISLLFLEDSLYPELLRKTADAPLCLFVRGRLDALAYPPIAMVGTRKVTGYGRDVAEILTTQLVEKDSCIVSGCMVGIDQISHQVALAQQGHTIGVLGYGFNYVYPSRVASLLLEMEEAGQLLLSEYSPEIAPSKGTFPERNRIVAGLSLATVIPEAAEPSGSFITARYALDYGRPVCAVPGPMTSIYSEGTKELINQGAALVTSAAEIWKQVEEYHLMEIWQKNVPTGLSQDLKQPKKSSFLPKKLPSDPNQLQVYRELTAQPLNSNDLLAKVNCTMTQILNALTILEITGLVRKDGDIWYAKTI